MQQRLRLRGVVAAALLLSSASPLLADEYDAILGATTVVAAVPQGPGNVSVIGQRGTSNTASVEQQAILGRSANVASIGQAGSSNGVTLTQTGGGNNAAVGQVGDGNSTTLSQPGNATAAVAQVGTNLGVNINQSANSSIGVVQFGAGIPGTAITITTAR
ncbi:hypothetical protein [Rhodomicrobium vannielii]|nr:hypothetical protein [Rhodomicrobium vannielii]